MAKKQTKKKQISAEDVKSLAMIIGELTQKISSLEKKASANKKQPTKHAVVLKEQATQTPNSKLKSKAESISADMKL